MKQTAKEVATQAVNDAITDVTDAAKTVAQIQKDLGYQDGTYTKLAEYDKITNAVTTTLGEVNDDGKLTNFTTVEQNATEAKTTAAKVEQTVDANTKDLTAVKSDVSTLTTTANKISGRVTSLESRFDDDGNLLSTSGTNITKDLASTYTVKTDFNTLKGSVNALTADMASMSTQDSHYITADYDGEPRYVTYVNALDSTTDDSKKDANLANVKELYAIAINESNSSVFYIDISTGSCYTGSKNDDHTLKSISSTSKPNS